MSARVTVSICTYTALDLARLCVAAVQKHSPGAKIVLSSNGNPKAAEMFMQFKNVNQVCNPVNLGFGRAHNLAFFAFCDTEFAVFLNDDCIVGPGWLEKLMAPFDADPKVALCCPADSCSELRADFIGKRGGRREYCNGHCLMVRSAIAKDHGLFDESLPGLAYTEDADLSLRYRELGYKLAWADVHVVHYGGVTSRKMPIAQKWLEANCAFMRERWKDYLANPKRLFPCEPDT